jgi:hypothetical protein
MPMNRSARNHSHALALVLHRIGYKDTLTCLKTDNINWIGLRFHLCHVAPYGIIGGLLGHHAFTIGILHSGRSMTPCL